jgi:hypothetical protein
LNGTACPPNPGYFDNKTTIAANCSSAMVGCNSCTNSTYCVACDSGFYVNSTHKNCIDCHLTFNNCNLCSPTTCT